MTSGGSADKAGLKVGDIVTKCEDDKISTTSDLLLSVRKHNPGDTVTLTINRAGEEMTFACVLGSDEGQSTQKQQNNNSNNFNNQDMYDFWKYFFGF